MSTIVKTDPDDDLKTHAVRNTGKKRVARKRKPEAITAPQADLSKRIGWLRRKAKLYLDKIEP